MSKQDPSKQPVSSDQEDSSPAIGGDSAYIARIFWEKMQREREKPQTPEKSKTASAFSASTPLRSASVSAWQSRRIELERRFGFGIFGPRGT